MLQGVPVSCQLKQLARHDDPAEPLRQRGTPGRWHRQDRGAVILARKIPGQVLRIGLSRGSAPSLCRHRTRPRPAAPGRSPFTPGEPCPSWVMSAWSLPSWARAALKLDHLYRTRALNPAQGCERITAMAFRAIPRQAGSALAPGVTFRSHRGQPANEPYPPRSARSAGTWWRRPPRYISGRSARPPAERHELGL